MEKVCEHPVVARKCSSLMASEISLSWKIFTFHCLMDHMTKLSKKRLLLMV